MKAVKDKRQVNERGCGPTKFYLLKEAAGQILLKGCSLMTPAQQDRQNALLQR